MSKNKEFIDLITSRVIEQGTISIDKFDPDEWFEQWSSRPNIGLGHCKPIDLVDSEPDKVKEILQRITITPFKKPYGM